MNVTDPRLEFLFDVTAEVGRCNAEKLRGKYGPVDTPWWRKVAVFVAVRDLRAHPVAVAGFLDRPVGSVYALYRDVEREVVRTDLRGTKARQCVEAVVLGLMPPLEKVARER